MKRPVDKRSWLVLGFVCVLFACGVAGVLLAVFPGGTADQRAGQRADEGAGKSPLVSAPAEGDGSGTDTPQEGGGLQTAAHPCPVAFLETAKVSYSSTRTSESWQAYVPGGCSELARGVLGDLKAAGTDLVAAGYLDLSGNAWGCTVACADGSALIVALIPQSLGRASGEDNPIRVSVTRLLPPEEGALR